MSFDGKWSLLHTLEIHVPPATGQSVDRKLPALRRLELFVRPAVAPYEVRRVSPRPRAIPARCGTAQRNTRSRAACHRQTGRPGAKQSIRRFPRTLPEILAYFQLRFLNARI